MISLSAWGEQADALAAITNQIDQTTSHASGETLYLRVELFSIGQLGGSPVQLCPIGAIQTLAKQRNSVGSVDDDTVDATRGTQFQIVKTIDVRTPSVTSVLTVHNSVHGVASLETIGSLHPPFRVNITGVVLEANSAQPTVGGSGKPMRTLLISDRKGCFVTLRQLGTGAEDTQVHTGCRVIAHFVSGRKARRPGEPGSLWAYADSIIQVLSDTEPYIPTQGQEVYILAD